MQRSSRDDRCCFWKSPIFGKATSLLFFDDSQNCEISKAAAALRGSSFLLQG